MKQVLPPHCEVCGEKKKSTLQKHHIVERISKNSNNKPENLAVLCSNCHLQLNDNTIEIIGIFPYTNDYGRILVYKKNGIPNISGLDKPYYTPTNYARKVS